MKGRPVAKNYETITDSAGNHLDVSAESWLMLECANEQGISRTTEQTNMRTTAKTNSNIGDDLVIARMTRRTGVPGLWVTGTLNRFRFSVLVFAEHAECPDYELGTSRISKLWLKEQNGGPTAANFDRGWDIRPTTKIAAAIVDFLAANLADIVYRA
jgi:hypothetical protein